MCPTPSANGTDGQNVQSVQDAQSGQDVAQDGHNGSNGQSNGQINGHGADHGASPRPRSHPYQPVGDFLSNVGRFKIIESTLREGEQFANAFFDTGKYTCARCLSS